LRTRILVLPALVAVLITACSGTTAPSPVVDPSTAAVTSSSPATRAPHPAATTSASIAPPTVVAVREVLVTMTDTLRFTPNPITVRAGETVTFVVSNAGLNVHEFIVGSDAEQSDHAVDMASGEMAHGHDNAAVVEPGTTESLTMTFETPGSFLVGCHEPGHYESGMKATLSVVE
jgi:uncharacterized cupredoxin-like copper-binding protein